MQILISKLSARPLKHQASGWLQVLSHVDPKFGGIASSVPELCRATESQGGPLCPIASFCDEADAVSLQHAHRLTYFSSDLFRWIVDPKLRHQFKKLIRSAEGVHIHGVWEPHCAVSATLARACKRPYVISAHGMLERWALGQKRFKKALYAALIEARNLQRASCLRALTPEEVKNYRQVGLTAPIAVVPSGVDAPSGISGEAFLRSYPELAGKRIVLFLGRLHQKKGVSLLLHAWAESLARREEFQLVIAGPDSESTWSKLQTQVSELGLQRSVTFTGMLRDEKKWSALSVADLFVLPSYSEGFSISVLEALGMGRPVMVTDPCNIPEVREYDCGWVIPPQADRLRDSLHEFAALSESERLALGEHGRHLIEKKFSWPVIGKQMAEVYAWLQGGPKPATVDTV